MLIFSVVCTTFEEVKYSDKKLDFSKTCVCRSECPTWVYCLKNKTRGRYKSGANANTSTFSLLSTLSVCDILFRWKANLHGLHFNNIVILISLLKLEIFSTRKEKKDNNIFKRMPILNSYLMSCFILGQKTFIKTYIFTHWILFWVK